MKKSLVSNIILLLFALTSLTASGCTKDDSTNSIPVNAGTHTWLALGDSYTIGESVSASDRYPAQAAAMLNAKGAGIGSPEYIARTGWTTIDLQAAIQAATLKQSYDIVTLLIGVNDQYQGLDTGGYRTRFTQLLQTAFRLAGNQPTHVFVLSIPDYSVTPFGGGSKRIQAELEVFNRINKQVTLAYGVAYVDITPVSKMAETDQSYTAQDGLHPSGKQYSQWASLLSPVIAGVIK